MYMVINIKYCIFCVLLFVFILGCYNKNVIPNDNEPKENITKLGNDSIFSLAIDLMNKDEPDSLYIPLMIFVANHGNISAMEILASKYINDTLLSKRKVANFYLNKAVTLGSSVAKNIKGFDYISKGKYIEGNRLIREADSICNLPVNSSYLTYFFYLNGYNWGNQENNKIDEIIDTSEAINFLIKGVNKKQIDCLAELSLIYCKGLGRYVRPNIDSAKKYAIKVYNYDFSKLSNNVHIMDVVSVKELFIDNFFNATNVKIEDSLASWSKKY